jgi:outer membrane protein/protease secretion system outer membrane protein
MVLSFYRWPSLVSLVGGTLFWAVGGLVQTAVALDLGGAYEAALAQDSGIRAARAAAEAGRERLPQARAQWLPNVSLSASRNKNKLDASAPNSSGVAQNNQSDYFSSNQSLTLRQTLFNKVKSADFDQAGYQVADAEALLARELQNLATRVGEAYFGALMAEDQLALLLSQETLVRTQLDAAQKTFTAGAGTRTDIDEVQARLDLNAAQLLEAQQNVYYARQQLSVLINQPVPQLAALDVARLNLLPPSPATLAQWIVLADQNSPEVKALEARQEAARLQIDKTQAGHLPTLDVVVQWSISDSENVTRLNSSYDTRSVGVQLSVPLYAGGYVNSAVRQALAEHVRAVETLEATRRDLGLRIHKEFRGVTEGVLRVKALEQAVRSAEQAVISSRKSAQAGVRTQLDVLKADAQKMESMRDLAQARYLYLLSKLRLTALAGLAMHESIHEINTYLSVTN